MPKIDKCIFPLLQTLPLVTAMVTHLVPIISNTASLRIPLVLGWF